jgi:hypothetical protein
MPAAIKPGAKMSNLVFRLTEEEYKLIYSVVEQLPYGPSASSFIRWAVLKAISDLKDKGEVK